MRVSTQQQYLNTIDRMQNSQTTLAQLQEQIATGKRISQPSDDPSVAAQSIRLDRELAAIEKYQANIKIAQNRLDLEETQLDSMNTAIDRLREIAIEAGDGTNNDSNLKTLSTEIRSIVDQLAGYMNTQDAQGEYIFSGSKGFTQPYVLDSNGRYTYNGDNGQREIQIASNQYVASGDSGQELFESVQGDLNFKSTSSMLDVNLNNTTTTDFTFVNTGDKEQFEKYLEDNVKGDLDFRLVPNTAGAGQYDFQIFDTSGAQHYPNPPTIPVPPPIDLSTASVATPVNVDFHGVRIGFESRPLAADFPLSSTSERAGVEAISITNQAEADAFFEKYGDITAYVNEYPVGTGKDGSVTLVSSKTGAPIVLEGRDEFFVANPGTATEQLKVGGLQIDINENAATPASVSTNGYLLEAPATGSQQVNNPSLLNTSRVSNVRVFDEVALSAAYNAATIAPTAVAFSVTFSAAGVPTVQQVDAANAAVGAPIVLAAASPAQFLGVEFTFDPTDPLLQDETLRISITDDATTSATNEAIMARVPIEFDYDQQNILDVALDLADQLDKGTASAALAAELKTEVADALKGITVAQDRITQEITGVGSRQNALTNAADSHTEVKLFVETTLSNIADADLAAVASKLKLEEVLLQASQQTFASTSRLTLFNYIN